MSMPISRAVEHGRNATPRMLWLWLIIAAILVGNGIYHVQKIERSPFPQPAQTSGSAASLPAQDTLWEDQVLEVGENTRIQYVPDGYRVCVSSWDDRQQYFWYDDDLQGDLRRHGGGDVIIERFQFRNDSNNELPIRFRFIPYAQTC